MIHMAPLAVTFQEVFVDCIDSNMKPRVSCKVSGTLGIIKIQAKLYLA